MLQQLVPYALQVAHMGVTTTAVIHQPSYDVFRMFDDILLLCKGGRTAFYGQEAEVDVLQCHAGNMPDCRSTSLQSVEPTGCRSGATTSAPQAALDHLALHQSFKQQDGRL